MLFRKPCFETNINQQENLEEMVRWELNFTIPFDQHMDVHFSITCRKLPLSLRAALDNSLSWEEKWAAIAHTDKFKLLIDVSWKQASFRARLHILLCTAANRARIAITNFETQRCNLSLVFAGYQQVERREMGCVCANWNWQLFAYPRQINMHRAR
jgi:hypothetical protein